MPPSGATPAGATPTRPTPGVAARSRRWWGLILATAAVVYVADRLSKLWAVGALQPGESRALLGDLLRLHLIFNPGAAFSIGTGSTWIFTILQALVPLAILAVAPRIVSAWWAVGAGLAVGGALGNLTDRLTREPGFGVGHVVDFLELPHWPIFNVADSAIVAAAAVVAVATFRGIGAFAAAPVTSSADGEVQHG